MNELDCGAFTALLRVELHFIEAQRLENAFRHDGECFTKTVILNYSIHRNIRFTAVRGTIPVDLIQRVVLQINDGVAYDVFSKPLPISQYGGLPTLFTSIEIRKTEKGDVVEVSSSFTIDSEKGQPVFEPDAITTLSPGSANLIPVTKTNNGLECGVADETLVSMMMGWLEGINDPTKPISYSPTQLLLLDGGHSLGGVYTLCSVDFQEISGEGILTALFVNAVGTGVSFIQMSHYSNKAHWYYSDYPFDFNLLNTDATDNGKFLRVVSGKWEKSEFDGSDLSFGIHNAQVNDFLRVDSVTDGVPTRWRVDSIANAKGVNF